MKHNFNRSETEGLIQVKGRDFVLNGEKITLKGFSVGTWMNIEHFMFGMPGSESAIRQTFAEVYGRENARCFFRSYIENFLTEKDFEYMASLGLNSVRLPFNYHWFMDDDAPLKWKSDGFEVLDRVIGWCRKYGIYAVLDMHTTPGSQNVDWHSDNGTGIPLFWKYRCFREQMTALWGEIAAHYAQEKFVCGYDILNEPNFDLTAEEFNGWYKETTAGIRKHDEHHIIFLEGDDFGRSFELFDEPEDEQTAFALHFYPCVISAEILEPEMSDDERYRIVENLYVKELTARDKFGRPLWCGETGFELFPDRPQVTADLIRITFDLMKKYDVSWGIWSYKDARTMSMVMPHEDTPWINLKSRILEKWNHHLEQSNSEETLRYTIERFFDGNLSKHDFYTEEFRMRTIFHTLAVKLILKPELEKIPWEEIRHYPEIFRFENCETYRDVENAIKAFI